MAAQPQWEPWFFMEECSHYHSIAGQEGSQWSNYPTFSLLSSSSLLLLLPTGQKPKAGTQQVQPRSEGQSGE